MMNRLTWVVFMFQTARSVSLQLTNHLDARIHPISSRARVAMRDDLRRAFNLEVNLGKGVGVMRQQLEPLFSASDLVTVRYPVPFELDLEPSQGVMQITKSGSGVLVGDVLRACSSFQMQMDNTFGLFPLGTKPTQCLFLADGQPAQKVIEALVANTDDKASDVILVFERPRKQRMGTSR